MNDDLVLGLDPSSTVVGYAFKRPDQIGSAGLIEAGLIKPDTKRGIKLESFWRICSLRHYLRAILDEKRPTTILIEWTKGKVGRRRHHGQGAGLAVYGCGVGAIATECIHWCESARFITDYKEDYYIIPVLENDWTRGVPKADRAAAIASEYQQYDPPADPGGDIADAIGLIDWWLKEQLVK